MAKQQTKRRRKRYEAVSAYAGDVKPAGIFRVFGDVRLIRAVFVLMALALVAGGFGAVFGGTFGFGSQTQNQDFVLPDDNAEDSGTPQANATAEIKQYAAPPAMSIDSGKRYVATIKTALGEIQVELLADQAPQTVNNFVFLARDGFYNGLTFHQVAQGFDAQAGDPTCATGSSSCRGDGGPGYDLPQEQPGPFEPGTLGMANASQFFIALTASDQFAQFTPFGRVISGLDVAERLSQGTEIENIEINEG